jgi:hypothetical protein
MKGLLLLAVTVLLAGCAGASIVKVDDNQYHLRARELEREASASLQSASWQVASGPTTVAKKRGEGKLRVTLVVRIIDFGNRSGFSLDVKSRHAFDWLVFGMWGRDGLPAAKAAAQSWLDEFRNAHAGDLVPKPGQ